MSHTVDTFEHAGLTIRIVAEEYIDSHYNPREHENLGTMICWHPNYELGDEQFTHGDFPEAESMADVGKQVSSEREAVVTLALYLYDHSGISISCANFADTIDPGGWDTTAIGFIYTTRERVIELCGEYPYKAPDFEGTHEEWLAEQLRDEVAEYDKYLTGDAGGYVVEDEDGDELDSCWGFLGLGQDGYVRDAAKEAAECERRAIEREKSERAFWASRDVETVGC